MAKAKNELMFDPQWLDMTYEKYYFVPWPDAHCYDDIDNEEFVWRTQDGAFVSMEWICGDEEEEEDGPVYN